MKIKSSLIRDQFEIEDAHGETVVIPFTVNITETALKVRQAKILLGKAQGETVADIGRATLELYRAIFGDDTTQRLFDYYDNDYAALITDTMPYITETLLPRYQKAWETIVKAKKDLKRD